MKGIRRFSGAVALSIVMAGGLTIGVAPAEAGGGKKGGGDARTAICGYLYDVITYEYVNPIIKAMAMQLYDTYACYEVTPLP